MAVLNQLPKSERNRTQTREMRAYLQAVLEVSGLYAGQAFDLAAMLGNFKTHLDAGRFEKADNGKVLLTEVGREYFSSRLTSDPIAAGQLVSRAEVIEMVRKVIATQPEQGWEPIEVELS